MFRIERARLLRLLRDRVARRPSSVAVAVPTLGRAAVQLLDEMLAECGELEPSPDGASRPRRLAALERFDLRGWEYDALLLAVVAETDWRFGRLMGYLHDQPALTRPTVGLALALAGDGDDAPTVYELCDGPLVRDGLLAIEGGSSLPGRTLRPTADAARRVIADEDADEARGTLPRTDGLARLVLDDDVAGTIRSWVALAREGQAPPLFVAGAAGHGRRTLARAAAEAAELRLVAVTLGPDPEPLLVARRDARWYGASVLVDATRSEAPAWPACWDALTGVARPIVIVLPADQVQAAAAAAPVAPVIVALGRSDADTRRRLWRALTPSTIADDEVDALAARFAFGSGRIARAVEHARTQDAAGPSAAAIGRAARELGRAAMDAIAERLASPFKRADLVVTARVHAELDLASSWLLHQRRVQGDWGLGRRIGRGRGLTVLFGGEPGTGKTMAAQVLAGELDLDLYRIDLSRVLSKYIGETEKNLARLFDEAAETGGVLFFDEGDALFGKRTETRDAHDRYANIEISYLLQRMEEHDGVTVLATNRLRDIDEAFLRRFHVIADFTLPEPADRLQIWQRMLAPPVVHDGDLRLEAIARELQLSGGQIRNAVVAAAYFAAADDRPISWPHLERALRREFRRQGRVFDERVARTLSAATSR